MTWLNRFDSAYADFENSGFLVPKMFMEFVEAMRPRTSNERDYRFYSHERLKERLLLNSELCLDWNITNRKKLPDSARSAYLDYLQGNLDTGAFTDLGVENRSRIALDPNEILFHAWKLTDKRVLDKNCAGFYSAIEYQKNLEADAAAKSFGYLNAYSFKSNVTGLLKLMQAMACEYGFVCSYLEHGNKPRCILEKRLSDDLSVYLEWQDYYLLKTQGDVLFRYVIREPETKIWDRNDRSHFFSFELDEIVPGAGLYFGTRGIPKLIGLSLLVHVNFMNQINK